jgi:hypothetical protein
MTKDELMAALAASRDELLDALRRLAESDLSEGVYEGGWNRHQLVAHLVSIEWTYPRLLDLPAATEEEAATPRDTSVTVDDYNRRQVEKRSDASLAALLEEFERNRARTIAAVEAYPASDLARQVRSAGGTVGPLADVIRFVAVDHVRGHLADLGWSRSQSGAWRRPGRGQAAAGRETQVNDGAWRITKTAGQEPFSCIDGCK